MKRWIVTARDWAPIPFPPFMVEAAGVVEAWASACALQPESTVYDIEVAEVEE